MILATIRRQLRRHLPSRRVSMYDTVTVATVPPHPQAVAGYVGGHWPTFHALVRRFPHARHLSIAVNASEDAECLDIENGDATPAQAPGWVRRQHHRGVRRPCLYANRSTMPAVLRRLRAAGINRKDVRLWSANWTYRAHIDAGMDATQWTDHALGRNLDQSLCRGDFFDHVGPALPPPATPRPQPKPAPKPAPKPKPKPRPRPTKPPAKPKPKAPAKPKAKAKQRKK